MEGIALICVQCEVEDCCGNTTLCAGARSHAVVGRVAVVMAVATASGGLTSTIISGLVQVFKYRVLLPEYPPPPHPPTVTSTFISSVISTQIYKRDEAFNTNEIANSVLACLVAVTGCCPFIDPLWAILIGGMLTNLLQAVT